MFSKTLKDPWVDKWLWLWGALFPPDNDCWKLIITTPATVHECRILTVNFVILVTQTGDPTVKGKLWNSWVALKFVYPTLVPLTGQKQV